jgi:hypothetical protein
VLYRMRIYWAVPRNLPAFHIFFRDYLLPVQLRHGARLVGRWQTDDNRVVAIWEYDDRPAYEQIDAAVRADPATQRAHEQRARLPELFTAKEETFMISPTTGPPAGPPAR